MGIFYLKFLPDKVYQFTLGNRYTHNLIVPLRIHQVKIADDLYQLAIINFGYNYLFVILKQVAQVFRERPHVAQVRVSNCVALSLQFQASRY